MKAIFNFLFLFTLVSTCLGVNAQDFKPDDVVLKKSDSPHPGRIVISSIKNNYNGEIRVIIINEYGPHKYPISIGPNTSRDFPGTLTCNRVQAGPASSNKLVDIYYNPKEKQNDESSIQQEKEESHVTSSQQTTQKPQTSAQTSQPTVSKPTNPVQVPTPVADRPRTAEIKDVKPEIKPIPKKGPLKIEDIIPDFTNYLESIPFYSISSIEEDKSKIEEHITNLRNWKDKDEYIKEHHLNSYINANKDTITLYSENAISFIMDYLLKFNNREIVNKNECIDSINAIINSRIEERKNDIDYLSEEIKDSSIRESFDWGNIDWKTICLVVGIIFLLTISLIWFKKAKKRFRNNSLSHYEKNNTSDASSAIVVRRKTTSILKKQNLDDVIDNNAYFEINCSDFCNDSAVRKMYIKNSCIKDIYNMYAEDLRNPNNPKEDGCMVLGRWVHDAESNNYYVSLEHIVLPGDDAVFAEYELNFGGKIKLKVTEKLRKLRRETNLQYDLTCWVHSHPGLGVFFSNSDCNVQMQLKHPTHPLFLTAIVVDILTPQQEFGIFTFKHDSSINSKADLKKLYSLEEMYKWAVESERNTFKPEDYFNTIADAKYHNKECMGIELSNGAIIDICKLATEETSGFVGMVHGFCNKQGLRIENVAVTVSKNEAVPDNELIGCFIIATHCSIPSIRKAIANYTDKIKFVLVYTSSNGLLTSIPVVSQDISTDENCYGEQKLEDLKIWTRRKR